MQVDISHAASGSLRVSIENQSLALLYDALRGKPYSQIGPAGPKLRNRTNFRTYHERRLYSERFSLKFRCKLRGGGYLAPSEGL